MSRKVWVVLSLVGAVAFTGGCGDMAVDACKVNPTYTDAQGRCVEADDEWCDDDPCDSDDIGEVKHQKPSPPVVRQPTRKSQPRK